MLEFTKNMLKLLQNIENITNKQEQRHTFIEKKSCKQTELHTERSSCPLIDYISYFRLD